MSSVDPFSSRFEVFGRDSKHGVPAVNQEAFEELKRLLDIQEGGDGRVILLRAPRAGYGKSHLLQRVASALGDSHHFIRINLVGGRSTDAAHVLEFVLQALCDVVPDSNTLTHLDLLARQVLALGLEPLVASGEVPCQDRDGALQALREQPVETFDFHHDRAVTAHWTKSNFEILGPRLAAEVTQLSGASLRESSYWVELLFRFSTTAPDNVERSRLLFETVFRADLQNQSEGAAEERLHGLLSLLGLVTRVVFVVDDTEGLSTHPPDALELASFLSNLAQCCPGTLVVLSVNGDVWETAFEPRLPGGLVDRLTENEVVLGPLNEEQARQIIEDRAGPRAAELLESLEFGDADLYARGVLKTAAAAWKDLPADSRLAVVDVEEAEEEAEDDDEIAGDAAESKDVDEEIVLEVELDEDELADEDEDEESKLEEAASSSGTAGAAFAALVPDRLSPAKSREKDEKKEEAAEEDSAPTQVDADADAAGEAESDTTEDASTSDEEIEVVGAEERKSDGEDTLDTPEAEDGDEPPVMAEAGTVADEPPLNPFTPVAEEAKTGTEDAKKEEAPADREDDEKSPVTAEEESAAGKEPFKSVEASTPEDPVEEEQAFASAADDGAEPPPDSPPAMVEETSASPFAAVADEPAADAEEKPAKSIFEMDSEPPPTPGPFAPASEGDSPFGMVADSPSDDSSSPSVFEAADGPFAPAVDPPSSPPTDRSPALGENNDRPTAEEPASPFVAAPDDETSSEVKSGESASEDPPPRVPVPCGRDHFR